MRLIENTDVEDCIEQCLKCHDVCLRVIEYCLQKGGAHAAPAHIKMLMTCAEICSTSAKFMSMGSELHYLTCGLCADICDRCSVDCDRLATGDSVMTDCARICRDCAESCRKMSAGRVAA